MKNELRCNIVKIKLSDTEYKKLNHLVEKSGSRTRAEFIRNKIFLTERQIAKREKMMEKYGQGRLEEECHILSNMVGAINQYKANVNTEYIIEELEKEVKALCQLLK